MTAGAAGRGRPPGPHAVDLRGLDVAPEAVAAALGLPETDPLAVVDDDPAGLRRLLAAAARSRGHESAVADRVAELEAELDALGVGPNATDAADGARLAAARERAASAGEDVARLRERVASTRGRLRAAREAGRDPADAEAALAEATRELTEAETERVAADQALAAARDRARQRRDERERRLRLRDALSNRRREARADLAAAVYPAFAAAVRDVPGDAVPGDAPEAFDGDRVTAALAAVRVADRTEPVVLAVRRFDGAAEAAARLDAPVARL